MKCYYYLQVLLNVAKSITIYNTIKLKKKHLNKTNAKYSNDFKLCVLVTEDITQQLKKIKECLF